MPEDKSLGPVYHLDADGNLPVTAEMKKAWKDNGYIIVRGMLDAQEVGILKGTVEANAEYYRQNCYFRNDGDGGKVSLALWKDLTDDCTGVITRTEKVAGTFQELLEDEVYHYHSKLILKDAKTGGAHEWHQDYAYWYPNTCLYPDDMATIYIAIDDADVENGCLKMIPRSHKAGRIDHLRVGEQAGADITRVNYLKDRLGLVQVEMKAGDAMLFHSNILHRSEHNHSGRRRWAFLVAFSTKRNDPVIEHHHNSYIPLNKVSNDAVRKCTIPSELDDRKALKFLDAQTANNSLPSVNKSHV